MSTINLKQFEDLLDRKLDTRFAEFGKGIDKRFTAFGKSVNRRFNEVDKRLDGMDKRFDGMDSCLDGMDRRFDGIDSRLDGMDRRFDGIDSCLGGMDRRFDKVENQLGSLRSLEERTHRLEILHEATDDKIDRLIEVCQHNFERIVPREELDLRFTVHDHRISALETFVRK